MLHEILDRLGHTQPEKRVRHEETLNRETIRYVDRVLERREQLLRAEVRLLKRREDS